jgi:hypothetical protein
MAFKKILSVFFFNLLLLAVLVEVVSACYIAFRKPYLRKFEYVPTYLDFSLEDEYTPVTHQVLNPRIIDSTLPWGIWHVPNKMSRHRTNCFDIVMKFNRYGARGPEPEISDPGNIIFLGDSFTEGFGLSEAETIPAQFSSISGKPAINLGVSRSGSTQQSLIYRHFADSFKHKQVFMLIHLENDLIDNDFEQHDTVTRYYKPYRKDLRHPDAIVYRGHPDSSSMNSMLFQQKMDEFSRILIKRGLISHMQSDNYTWFGRLVRLTYSRRIWEMYLNYREARTQEETLPKVLAWRQRDLNILSYDMEQVMQIAEKHGARVTFINLPAQQLRARLQRHPENKQDYWALENQLKKIADKNGHQFRSYVEFLEQKEATSGQIYFTCDGHYNPNGAKMVAQFLAEGLIAAPSAPLIASLKDKRIDTSGSRAEHSLHSSN